MNDIDPLRPIVVDAIEKFRFGAAAFLLRHMAQHSPSNPLFVKHLADIYDNLHILWLSPERDFAEISRYAVPLFDQNKISEVEFRYFDSEVLRFKESLRTLERSHELNAAGSLLKSYYCLCNGSNLGAVVTFGKAIRELQNTVAPLPHSVDFLASIKDCAIASVATEGTNSNPGLNFSFYVEYDRARTWVLQNFSIDIYEMQRKLSPRFLFGGS